MTQGAGLRTFHGPPPLTTELAEFPAVLSYVSNE